MAGPGLLIVNADDFGHDPHATDRTLECFLEGRITSTTAMVFMKDSERACRLALEAGIPVGLHLNLSEAFSDPATPADAHMRQARLVRRFGRDRGRQLRRWLFDPAIQADLERCIDDQLSRFSELYGGAPTHIDGHQHVHVSLNVLAARSLPARVRMRGAAGSHPFSRALRRRLIARRFIVTDHFFDIADVDPRRPNDEGRRLLDLSHSATVEVMAHPGFPAEHARLNTPEWQQALGALRLGSFADLDPPA
jgi:predicted glycoside hydrolase/deacetylase ChbG (UPF0249 family)